MKKTTIKIASLFTAAFLFLSMIFPLFPAAEAAGQAPEPAAAMESPAAVKTAKGVDADGFAARINALRSVYPAGSYWNHCVSEDRFNGDNLLAAWNTGDRAFAEQFADSVTGTPCRTHNGTCPVGYYDCNVFDGGMQCWGFARKIFFDIFGVRCSALAQDNNVDHVKAGSYVRLGSDGPGGHSVFVTKREGNMVTVVECNYAGNDVIKWDRQFDITNPGGGVWFSYCYNAPNFDQVNGNPAGVATGVQCTLTPACAPNMRLDVNGGSGEDEANIQIYTANGSPAQKFVFEEMGDGYFRILTSAGKAVDVRNNNAVSGETVWQYGRNDTDAQLWKIVDAGDGYVYLIPKSNPNLHMDVTGRQAADYTNVQVYEANTTSAQLWRIHICY